MWFRLPPKNRAKKGPALNVVYRGLDLHSSCSGPWWATYVKSGGPFVTVFDSFQGPGQCWCFYQGDCAPAKSSPCHSWPKNSFAAQSQFYKLIQLRTGNLEMVPGNKRSKLGTFNHIHNISGYDSSSPDGKTWLTHLRELWLWTISLPNSSKFDASSATAAASVLWISVATCSALWWTTGSENRPSFLADITSASLAVRSDGRPRIWAASSHWARLKNWQSVSTTFLNSVAITRHHMEALKVPFFNPIPMLKAALWDNKS